MNISQNNMPLISIIIPTYNHAHLIGKCLSSIKNQTYTNWEAIVVNNFSNDKTIDVVSSFCDPRIKLINFKNNGIIASSRNEGIRNAKGEYLAFLDSDDWWYPKKLEKVLKSIKDSDLVFHDLDIYVNGNKCNKKIRGRNLLTPIFKDLMTRGGNPIANSSVVVRSKLVHDVGCLSENINFITVEDFDLWLKLSRITEKFLYIPESLGAYYLNGSNSSTASERCISTTNNIYAKHLTFLSDEDKKESEKILNYLIARFRHKMGQYDLALKLYKRSFLSKDYKIAIKSLVLMIQSSFFSLFIRGLKR